MKDSQKKISKNSSRLQALLLPIMRLRLSVSSGFSRKENKKKITEKTFAFTIRSWHIFLTLLVANIIIFSIALYNYELIRQNRISSITYDPQIASYPQVLSLSDLDATSQALAVYDTTSRVYAYSKNENFRFAPASTTKIVTALVALSYYTPETVLTARNPDAIPGSEMGLFEGEQMTVENLLYGLMLPSGNDAAYVLSSNYPGGTVAFVNEMNALVASLQLKNTQFFDPSGFSDDNYTTAHDLARIAAHATENKLLSEIVKTKSKVVYDTPGALPHSLRNLNELLDLPGVTGMKTGYTEEAGGVLVTTFNHFGRTYVIVILKSEDRFGDTREVMEKIVGRIQLLKY